MGSCKKTREEAERPVKSPALIQVRDEGGLEQVAERGREKEKKFWIDLGGRGKRICCHVGRATQENQGSQRTRANRRAGAAVKGLVGKQVSGLPCVQANSSIFICLLFEKMLTAKKKFKC